MSASPNYIVTGVLVLGLLFLWRNRDRGKLPPGPPSRPLLGNVHHIARVTPWVSFKEISKTYGPIICFRIFNITTIVLHKYRDAANLMEHRSSSYANRPTLWMVQLGGRKNSPFWMKSSDSRFKLYRRLFHKVLNPNALGTWESIQLQEVRTLLQNLRETPDEFLAHLRRNAVAIMMNTTYGYQITSNDDNFVSLLEESFKLSGVLNMPGKYLVEFFPLLRFVPEWFPGAGFKRLARTIGEKMVAFERTPFEWAKNQITSGKHQESFVSQQLLHGQFGQTQEEKEDIIMWCALGLYAGGGETTVSIMSTFFLLMMLYPDVQKRAQEEVDHVLGGRVPTIDDQQALPYVEALIKETLRWGPIAPLGIAHAAHEDDTYEGYFIPKGARIVANIWAIGHDEEEYPDPDTFDPTRFLGENPQLDPTKYVFGFGRRICPGSHLANTTLFLNITSVLSYFTIAKKKDQHGKEIEPDIEWVTAPTTRLKPFQCSITPRERDVDPFPANHTKA